MYNGDCGYIFQAADSRVIFVMPYEDEFSLIGTTEGEWLVDDGPVTISPEETDYLCAAVNDYFTLSISPKDVISSYAGVRPLYDDNAASDSVVTHRAA